MKLVECLVELVSSSGWKSDNETFRLGCLSTTIMDDDKEVVGH